MRTILATLHSKFIHNSLALPSLAAYCGKTCGEILIREFTTHEPKESILAMLVAEDPDVIAFSVYLWNRHEIFELVDSLAVVRPELKIVVGGPEISFEGISLFERHPGLTALIRGEGEIPLRELLQCWHQGQDPGMIARTILRSNKNIDVGPDSSPLIDLDSIPSPFQLGFVDLSRGFVYYETSRGCPFSCSFCLSARDNVLRCYSTQRVQKDLLYLMKNRVPKVKIVDRTFNYDVLRAFSIFEYILENNLSTHFHFEIAAHLLDEATLELLGCVPKGVFQFEIGIQSTQEQTLSAIGRRVNMTKLENNIRWLSQNSQIDLHLDLVAGLPGDDYTQFINSVDQVSALRPEHLQIELVKLLPGSPLRDDAQVLGIQFDPNPPYEILSSPHMSFSNLQKVKDLSRMIDIIYNSGYFSTFLNAFEDISDSLAKSLVRLAEEWRQRGLFRFPIKRESVFTNLIDIINYSYLNESKQQLVESLAYDYACCERIALNRVPYFFDIKLLPEEQAWARKVVENTTNRIKGQGIKLQYFTAVFSTILRLKQRTPCLFIYLTQTGTKRQVEVHFMN